MADGLLNIEIDGKPLQVKPGSMVIEAADAAGIYIPRFCYHKKLSVAANCRMCLVDVEKSGKPLPACATPVTEGMKVSTRSQKTHDAQKGVMEFLLINHPLDCPICDQGGECALQDLAVGYGKDVSRYQENKRIVKDEDIGPLIETEMTRCIHCTRCVRFGQEIAGIMELGATGRGEHMRIGTYIARSVDSELSGNVIDLCPVGALTSKPFRFTARTWELKDMPSVSPHDCVGTNIDIQVLRNQVKRVLPRENEDINEVWIADRDRFSYLGLNSGERLTVPMVRDHNGAWRETDWQTALEFTAAGLRKLIANHGADQLGALASPLSTLEEFFLLQKLMRGLGSHHIDHRLRARDFSNDARAPLFPWLGMTIPALQALDGALLVGSNIRKEQPLLGHRLRQAFLRGARIAAINPVDYDFTFALANKSIVRPDAMALVLASVAGALSERTGKPLPPEVAQWASGEISATARAMADLLVVGTGRAVILGQAAINHAHAAALRALAELVCDLSGATLACLPEANSAAAWLAGCLPHRGPVGQPDVHPGLNAQTMLNQARKGYVLLGFEPELDCASGRVALEAMQQADFVVALSPFKTRALDYADVLLPASPFTETSGTFVNCEGRWQSFAAAVKPLGETRPAWKILRVLGNLLHVSGFDYSSSEEVRDAVPHDVIPSSRSTPWQFKPPPASTGSLLRISEIPIYAVDGIVRRSPPLQQTADNPPPAARMNAATAHKLGVDADARVRVQVEGEAEMPVAIDRRVPDDCVLVAAAHPDTIQLGGEGTALVTRVS